VPITPKGFDITTVASGAIFSGENFGENSAEIFPLKMSGKIGIFRGKSFKKLFPQEIMRKNPWKITFRGKKCTKNRPLGSMLRSSVFSTIFTNFVPLLLQLINVMIVFFAQMVLF
jgi:hypothetical protein